MTKKIVAYQINGKPAYKDIDIPDGMVYYYCDYVEDADKSIIISYVGIIEYKP